jgi:predicted nuclease of restriction endonuclease-like (RecB) superfamily
MDFNTLITALSKINDDLLEQSLRAVNTSLTLRNWFFGFYIVEFEQNGNDRAQYGKGLLASIAKEMKGMRIPNSDDRELRRYRQFYLTYPDAAKYVATDEQIKGLLPAGFATDHIEISSNQIRGLANPEFNDENIEISSDQIRGTVSPELPEKQIEFSDNRIRGSANPEFTLPKDHYVNLFNRVSYTHFIELIRIEDSFKRLFYELECIKGTWTIKELKRQIGSLLYERTGLSKNKEKLIALTHENATPLCFPDLIRDPYIFEFMGLKQHEVLPEKELEQALLDHLLQFLLELGKGFCFEARQKRIIIDNEHHFIDLVFYHRLLHCNILIDLKTERFNHSHDGQLNMYLEYYKKYEMAKGDNPPVGILLCTGKDQEHVEFATAGMDDKVFVSQYQVGLPGKQELEQFIKRQLREG